MYGTIIINESIQNSISLLESYKNKMSDYGNLYVFVRNEFDNSGDITLDFLDVIAAANKFGYIYINTIVVPTEDINKSDLPDNILYIVWLAKNNNHFFNKDMIRESHIWKNVEWGKRSKNYNPKGKDPGNVWIPTKDDGKANITEHILLSLSDIINRIYSCSAQNGFENIYITSKSINNLTISPNIIVKQTNYSNTKKYSKRKIYKKVTNTPIDHLSGSIVWDTSENLDKIPDESINVVITSPPYWDLKDYFKKGQIGQESYQTYLDRLYTVWQGCYKKLCNNGSLWLNINIRKKNGNVILIPKDFVEQCRKIGFHYKGILIWHKSSGIPTNNKNIVDRHEYVLIFSKSKDLNINKRIFDFSDYKNEKINGGLIWNINRKAGSIGKHFIHPAIYPNELVTRIVQITTNPNDTVLDPFLGSGTTLIASVLENRNCIGYEYNEGFKDLIMSRIKNEISKKTFSLRI